MTQQTDRQDRRLHFHRVKVGVEHRGFFYFCLELDNPDYKNNLKTVIPVKLKTKVWSLVIIQVLLVIYT